MINFLVENINSNVNTKIIIFSKKTILVKQMFLKENN